MAKRIRKRITKKNPVTLLLSALALVLSLLFAYNLATAIDECRPYVRRTTDVSQFEDYFAEARYGSMAKYSCTNEFTTDTPDVDPSHIYAFTKTLNYRMLALAYSEGPGRDEKRSKEYLDLYKDAVSTIDRYRYSHALEQFEAYTTR